MRHTYWMSFVFLAAAAGAVAFVPGLRAERLPAADEQCGLGPPPDAPDFAAFQERRRAEMARRGYEHVCEENLARFAPPSSIKPVAWTMAGLAFQPVRLDGTPFAGLELLGAQGETMGDARSRLYRNFRMPGGRTLTLFEHDMSADGSRSYRNPQDEPERVNGLPARLIVLQAASGKAVSVLDWKEGRRNYQLWLDANVVLANSKAELFALASSLPKSVPARASEPESPPLRLGPDGMPVDEPEIAGVGKGGNRQGLEVRQLP
ncbi:hypothetical protein HH212_01380 [Massilia forsythiae]|uniref:Uncharacterized protein n=1 Tax=Massilia forsythiae TaxID=2728020 RepID=A0A7Z2ZQX2_9BURK|nr:hypothetical protein [Massilia forsythiae]QJD98857.1 hypothetical protein HH212_01380 [Massilia forsythiae]